MLEEGTRLGLDCLGVVTIRRDYTRYIVLHRVNGFVICTNGDGLLRHIYIYIDVDATLTPPPKSETILAEEEKKKTISKTEKTLED